MKWINPRNKLPEVNDQVWVITVRDKLKELSPSNVRIEIGITRIDETTGERFIETNYFKSRIWFYRQSRNSEVLAIAWALYASNALPNLEPLSAYESEALIAIDPCMNANKSSNEAWGSRKLKFIACKDSMPNRNGAYAVVCTKGIGIVHYNGQANGYWMMPNGMNEKITHWFPLPAQLPI